MKQRLDHSLNPPCCDAASCLSLHAQDLCWQVCCCCACTAVTLCEVQTPCCNMVWGTSWGCWYAAKTWPKLDMSLLWCCIPARAQMLLAAIECRLILCIHSGCMEWGTCSLSLDLGLLYEHPHQLATSECVRCCGGTADVWREDMFLMLGFGSFLYQHLCQLAYSEMLWSCSICTVWKGTMLLWLEVKQGMVQLCSLAQSPLRFLKHLHNAEMRFYWVPRSFWF